MRRFYSWVVVAMLCMGLVACSGGDGVDETDAGNSDVQSFDDAGDSDTDTGENVCEPVTCEDLGETCGNFDDGCEGDLDCGECSCDEATFLDDCPTRACETLVGCESSQCVYEPVETDDGLACTGCIGDECSDSDVRYCSPEDDDACPVYFCDPSPSDADGSIRFDNEIVTDHRYDCGLCDLGYRVCDGGTFECDDIEVPGVDPDFAECDSTQTGTTFIYVDSTYTGSDQDGSSGAPYASLNQGLEQAQQRNSEAVIVGGSGQYQETIDLKSGISILGGFEHQPYWQRDTDQRPVISVGTDDIEDELLVGLRAVDIVDITELRNLDVQTADVIDHSGVSTAALYAVNATGLRLVDVTLEAGAGGHGEDGTQGASATATGGDGEDGHDGEKYGAGFHTNCEYLFSTDQGTNIAPTPPVAAGGINSDCSGANGGDGGRGDEKDPNLSAQSDTMHLPGQNSAAGQCENPYGATTHPLYDSNNECGGRYYQTNGSEYSDQNGRDGLAHSGPAASGSNGQLAVTIDGTDFVPEGHGGDGADGADGRGGGGATSGHGRSTADAQCYLGAGGGGGGAGGCGGAGGTGGDAGGWSMGIITHNSSGLGFSNVEVIAGDAGNGGVGGSGGTGSSGGSGGSGGDATLDQDQGWPGDGDGRDGGDGSAGQTGGDGGDGAGGSSIAIYCNDSTTIAVENGLTMSHGTAGSSSGDDGVSAQEFGCVITE